MSHLFRMIVGDCLDVGHKQKEKFVILSSHPLEDVQSAYEKSVNDFGFDPIKSIAKTRQNNKVPMPFVEKLIARGFQEWSNEFSEWSSFFETFEEDKEVLANAEDFINIILFMVHKNIPELECQIVEGGSKAIWNCGGYGLIS